MFMRFFCIGSHRLGISVINCNSLKAFVRSCTSP
ncbi:unnamed protein product [Acanthoscelides obtectus]|uniref:Uncharacterized protein n=1 Tax=Acanthoscelides obtectus TaxID=200917 RepID=A0A9P0M4P2_ACAOB|nr:unnamed protein product [Acanthoscelides obtectus]CAK1645009.1 hypothetical protein AOBTE_LOCUS13985 [Acanthoscelides obtectus]